MEEDPERGTCSLVGDTKIVEDAVLLTGSFRRCKGTPKKIFESSTPDVPSQCQGLMLSQTGPHLIRYLTFSESYSAK